jgi:hypothetical protein
MRAKYGGGAGGMTGGFSPEAYLNQVTGGGMGVFSKSTTNPSKVPGTSSPYLSLMALA